MAPGNVSTPSWPVPVPRNSSQMTGRQPASARGTYYNASILRIDRSARVRICPHEHGVDGTYLALPPVSGVGFFMSVSALSSYLPILVPCFIHSLYYLH